MSTTQHIDRGPTLIKAVGIEATDLPYEVVARLDTNSLSLIVVRFTDGEVWTAWTDGPRSSAEPEESLEAAMRSFASEIENQANNGYYTA